MSDLEKTSYILGVTDGKEQGFKEGIKFAREQLLAIKKSIFTCSESYQETLGWEITLDELDLILKNKMRKFKRDKAE